jgi:predicted dehydrogenase
MVELCHVAVVGAGFMGGVHADLLAADPRVAVRWIVDKDLAAAQDLASRLGAEATDDLGAALADPAVRLVVIATPAASHYALAERVLSEGRHALVEKPLVLSAGEAEKLALLAKDRGLVLAHGGNFVYAPKFVRAAGLAADRAALGTVHTVRVVFRTSGPDEGAWFRERSAAGGGALTDLGWHAVELCRFLLGKPEIAEVSAVTRNVTGLGDVEEQGVILLGFEGGAVGQCDVSWLCPGGEQLTVEVLGTEGSVSADLWGGMGISAHTNTTFADVWEPNGGWSRPEWEWIRNSGYEHQDRQVVDAVVRSVPLTQSPEDAVAILRALDAAYRSAEEGRSVRIDG